MSRISRQSVCEAALGCFVGKKEKQNVAAVPGDAFGASGEGFLRCCYAADVKLIKSALDGFRKFLADIK